MRIVGQEVRWFAVEIGEVASTATRHQYFLADSIGPFENNDIAVATGRGNRAHESGGTATNNQDIGIRHAGRITGALDANEAVDGTFVQLAHAFQERQL